MQYNPYAPNGASPAMQYSPQDLEKLRQFLANQMPSRQPGPQGMSSTMGASTYMPPAPMNTAYMPSRQTAPMNTAYMPSRQTAPMNTAYMPSPAQTYGMSATTTPNYGMSNAQIYGGQMMEPSYSPNQAGKYNVDGSPLRNTDGMFNRPQT